MQHFSVLFTLTRFCLLICIVTLLTGASDSYPGPVLAAPAHKQIDNSMQLNSSRTGVVVPLYVYPGDEWSRLVQAKNNFARVPMIAVINPNSGPGSYQDANYVDGIQNLRASGILVLGYVHTSYASRSLNDVIADIDKYRNWYGLDGLFLDEMSSLAGDEAYYSSLNTYIKSLGFQYTMGNPATGTLPSYIGTMDNFTVYENSGLPDVLPVNSWHESYPKQNFTLLAHSVNMLDTSAVIKAFDHVGYLYITSDVLPNPYDTLPDYFEELVSALNNFPPVVNNGYSVSANMTLNVPAPGVLEHDSDPDGDQLTAVLISGPGNGTVTLNPDGSFSYTPQSGLSGNVTDTFTYKAFDGISYSHPATVTILIVEP